MSVKELVQSAYEKDASKFESVFEDIMANRMESAISVKFDDMFESKYKDEDDDDDKDEDDDDKDDDDKDEDDD